MVAMDNFSQDWRFAKDGVWMLALYKRHGIFPHLSIWKMCVKGTYIGIERCGSFLRIFHKLY